MVRSTITIVKEHSVFFMHVFINRYHDTFYFFRYLYSASKTAVYKYGICVLIHSVFAFVHV